MTGNLHESLIVFNNYKTFLKNSNELMEAEKWQLSAKYQ